MAVPADRRSPLPPLFGPVPLRLGRWQRVWLGVGLITLLLVVGFLADVLHPVSRPPQGSAVERQIATVFAAPSQAVADDRITGDLMVERFYILDMGSGERYVVDFLKGRIQGLQTLTRPDGATSYMAILDATNLSRSRRAYSDYVRAIAPPDPSEGYYLGLMTSAAREDAFPLNYSDPIPAQHQVFRSPDGEDAQQFLLDEAAAKDHTVPRLVHVQGYTFLLSNSDYFAAFRSQYGLDKTIFLSETLIVDATAPENRAQLLRLLAQ